MGSITSIPDSGNTASSRTFGACTSLIEADLSTTPLTYIGVANFVGCSSLSLIKLPSTLTSIGDWAFACGTTLASNRVYVINATTPPTLPSGNTAVSRTLGAQDSTAMGAIYVPDGYVQTYKEAAGWSYYANVIDSISNMPSV